MNDLSGKLIIKVALGEDIRRIPIHNEDITYDELILMMQRVFRDQLSSSDDITLKYKDEDGDLITLFDSADLAAAIAYSRLLKLTLFVNGRIVSAQSGTTSISGDLKKELRQIRDRINHLLDAIEDKTHENGDPHEKGDEPTSAREAPAGSSTSVTNGPGKQSQLFPAEDSREFDPLQQPQPSPQHPQVQPQPSHQMPDDQQSVTSRTSVSSAAVKSEQSAVEASFQQPQQQQQPAGYPGFPYQGVHRPQPQQGYPPSSQSFPAVSAPQQQVQQAPSTQAAQPAAPSQPGMSAYQPHPGMQQPASSAAQAHPQGYPSQYQAPGAAVPSQQQQNLSYQTQQAQAPSPTYQQGFLPQQPGQQGYPMGPGSNNPYGMGPRPPFKRYPQAPPYR